ncbi:hypothetical protein MUK42_34183 [Musa troglodytarum]|uniref:Uncharacterized protein n=1 Tax=Musa troglodytarum TaxID=320322 RepID=A0A9E7KKC6_9LILI|nr:hypothetical protein MUK42_34183 [Musa troglodytarum]
MRDPKGYMADGGFRRHLFENFRDPLTSLIRLRRFPSLRLFFRATAWFSRYEIG